MTRIASALRLRRPCERTRLSLFQHLLCISYSRGRAFANFPIAYDSVRCCHCEWLERKERTISSISNNFRDGSSFVPIRTLSSLWSKASAAAAVCCGTPRSPIAAAVCCCYWRCCCSGCWFCIVKSASIFIISAIILSEWLTPPSSSCPPAGRSDLAEPTCDIGTAGINTTRSCL